jgi:imidazolonepropionase-like amidohydrolase
MHRWPAMDDYWIHAGWVIDGSGGPCRKNVHIRIRKDRIHGVFDGNPTGEIQEPVFDYSDCTVLPGLIDAHVHLSMSGTGHPGKRIRQLETDDRSAEKTIRHHIDQHLRAGVVAVRDGGDRAAHVLRYRNSIRHVESFPLILKVSGHAWHAPERYGQLIGHSPAAGMTLSEGIETGTKVVDQVKIVNSGLNSLKQFGKQTRPQFSPAEMKTAVAVSRGMGKTVMVHANGEIPVSQSILAGCRSIEHGFFMGRDNLRRLVENDTFWVPTAGTMKAYADNFTGADPAGDIAGKNLDHQLQQIAWGREIGVRFAVGTDAGSPGVHHGHGLSEELKLFLSAGFSLEEAVMACCRNGARLLGLKNLGCLLVGWEATLIAVQAAPDALLDRIAAPCAFFVRGTRIFPETDPASQEQGSIKDAGTSRRPFR